MANIIQNQISNKTDIPSSAYHNMGTVCRDAQYYDKL